MGVKTLANIDFNSIAAFTFAAFLLYIIARLLLVPVKLIIRLIGSALVGGVLLIIFNLLGSLWGIKIGINIITALVVGFLGIPGLVMIIIVQKILGG